MSWAKLDDGMPDDAKIADLSDAAFRAYVTGICHAARKLTDGYIPLSVAKKLMGRARVIKELSPDPWHVTPNICDACRKWPEAVAAAGQGTGFYIHMYLKYNPTKEKVEAERAEKHEAKVRAGQAGAARRWQSDSRGHSKAIAEGIANAKQKHGPVPVPVPVLRDQETFTTMGGVTDLGAGVAAPPGDGLPFEPPPEKSRKRPLSAIEADLPGLRDDFLGIDVDDQLVRFRDHLKAKNKTYTDYVAAFRNWLRNERTWANDRASTTNAPNVRRSAGRYQDREQQGDVAAGWAAYKAGEG